MSSSSQYSIDYQQADFFFTLMGFQKELFVMFCKNLFFISFNFHVNWYIMVFNHCMKIHLHFYDPTCYLQRGAVLGEKEVRGQSHFKKKIILLVTVEETRHSSITTCPRSTKLQMRIVIALIAVTLFKKVEMFNVQSEFT